MSKIDIQENSKPSINNIQSSFIPSLPVQPTTRTPSLLKTLLTAAA